MGDLMTPEVEAVKNKIRMKLSDIHILQSIWPVMAIVSVLLTSCAVGPDYKKPDIDMPGAYHKQQTVSEDATTDDFKALAKWWTHLDDPLLTRLIDAAVAKNRDFKKAESRVMEAQYRRRIS
jgi:outer membrane protein TolC